MKISSWPLPLTMWPEHLLSRGIHCTKFEIFQAKGSKEILNGHYLVYRPIDQPTDRCKTICPFFKKTLLFWKKVETILFWTGAKQYALFSKKRCCFEKKLKLYSFGNLGYDTLWIIYTYSVQLCHIEILQGNLELHVIQVLYKVK